jgi:hypothetical protein
LAEVALLSVVIFVGACIMIVFLGLAAHRWFLSNALIIIACTAAILVCFCAIAPVGAIVWHRPRVEIGLDGFADYGILGHRSRRWSDVEGNFTVIQVGWPFAVGSRHVVAYRLTSAFKDAARKKFASMSGNDEAILICPELAIKAEELAKVLNQWKQGLPRGTTSA